MNPAPTIRPGTPQDTDALIAIDHLASSDPARAGLIRRGLGEGNCFVCQIDGAAVGYCILTYMFFENGLVAMLYTKPENRRSGIATATLRHCELTCRTAKLFSSTNQSNKPMQSLLLKNGYSKSGFIENLDEGDPELVYFKRVRTSL